VLEQRYQIPPIEHRANRDHGSIAASPRHQRRYLVYTFDAALSSRRDTCRQVLDVPSNTFHFIAERSAVDLAARWIDHQSRSAHSRRRADRRPVRYILWARRECVSGTPRGARAQSHQGMDVMRDGRVVVAKVRAYSTAAPIRALHYPPSIARNLPGLLHDPNVYGDVLLRVPNRTRRPRNGVASPSQRWIFAIGARWTIS